MEARRPQEITPREVSERAWELASRWHFGFGVVMWMSGPEAAEPCPPALSMPWLQGLGSGAATACHMAQPFTTEISLCS